LDVLHPAKLNVSQQPAFSCDPHVLGNLSATESLCSFSQYLCCALIARLPGSVFLSVEFLDSPSCFVWTGRRTWAGVVQTRIGLLIQVSVRSELIHMGVHALLDGFATPKLHGDLLSFKLTFSHRSQNLLQTVSLTGKYARRRLLDKLEMQAAFRVGLNSAPSGQTATTDPRRDRLLIPACD